jgi:dihydrofolate reductase
MLRPYPIHHRRRNIFWPLISQPDDHPASGSSRIGSQIWDLYLWAKKHAELPLLLHSFRILRSKRFFLITGVVNYLYMQIAINIWMLMKENPMRKVIVSEFVTLDGVIEAPNQWSFQFGSEEQNKYKFDELFACDALLLGRVTYQGFAAAWPTMPGTGEYGERMNSLPKYVVSTTLQEAEWNATLIKGQIAEEVAKLKQEVGQDIVIFGSGDLVHALTQLDLIDEYRLMVFPIVVGSGMRLFPEGTEKKVLKLVDTKTFSSGVVVLTYQKV